MPVVSCRLPVKSEHPIYGMPGNRQLATSSPPDFEELIMRSNKIVAAVIVVQSIVIASLLGGQGGTAAVAKPDAPQYSDPGARQLQMVEELKSINAKLDRVTAALGGELVVRVKAEDAKR